MANDNIWIAGVVLVIIGSLGQNVGQNIISHAHKIIEEVDDRSAKLHASLEERGSARVNSSGEKYKTSGDELCKTTDELDKSERDVEAQTVISAHDANTNEELKNLGTDEERMQEMSDQAKKRSSEFIRTLGTVTFITGSLFTFASFAFGSQSLIASLESIQFVSNVVCLKYIHKEYVSWKVIICTILIIIGNALVVVFSNHDSLQFTGDTVVQLYRENTRYHVYLIVMGLMWFICQGVYQHYHESRRKHIILWKHSLIEPLTFVLSSTIIGTQAVLDAKCLSMLIQMSIIGENEFLKPVIYVVLFTWILLVAFWLRRMDLGLAFFPPVFIIPVLQVFFILLAIICGGIYFEEFNSYTTDMWIGFIIGVFLILVGVYGLAPDKVDILGMNAETTQVVPVDDLGKAATIDKLEALTDPGTQDDSFKYNSGLSTPSESKSNINIDDLVPPMERKVKTSASAVIHSGAGSEKSAEAIMNNVASDLQPEPESPKRRVVKRQSSDNI